MQTTNKAAAQMFRELADLLDLAGELPFKAASYRKVAESLRDLQKPFSEIVRAERWGEIPGAGKAIREKLQTLADTGKVPALDKWRRHEIASFFPALAASGLKPRPLGSLARKLEAKNIKDLADRLKVYDIKKLSSQLRETASIITGDDN